MATKPQVARVRINDILHEIRTGSFSHPIFQHTRSWEYMGYDINKSRGADVSFVATLNLQPDLPHSIYYRVFIPSIIFGDAGGRCLAAHLLIFVLAIRCKLARTMDEQTAVAEIPACMREHRARIIPIAQGFGRHPRSLSSINVSTLARKLLPLIDSKNCGAGAIMADVRALLASFQKISGDDTSQSSPPPPPSVCAISAFMDVVITTIPLELGAATAVDPQSAAVEKTATVPSVRVELYFRTVLTTSDVLLTPAVQETLPPPRDPAAAYYRTNCFADMLNLVQTELDKVPPSPTPMTVVVIGNQAAAREEKESADVVGVSLLLSLHGGTPAADSGGKQRGNQSPRLARQTPSREHDVPPRVEQQAIAGGRKRRRASVCGMPQAKRTCSGGP